MLKRFFKPQRPVNQPKTTKDSQIVCFVIVVGFMGLVYAATIDANQYLQILVEFSKAAITGGLGFLYRSQIERKKYID